jgi:hypothetical protein
MHSSSVRGVEGDVDHSGEQDRSAHDHHPSEQIKNDDPEAISGPAWPSGFVIETGHRWAREGLALLDVGLRHAGFPLRWSVRGVALQSSTGTAVPPSQMAPRGSPAARNVAVASWRFLAVGLLAFWQGGFMFYGGVVIHIAHRVLGSHLEVGFITQRVTNWLNVIGAVTLIVLAANLLITRRRTGRMLWWGLTGTWAVMAVAMIVLLATHPMLDRVLDAHEHEVLDRVHFGLLHKVYLGVSTIQWAAAMLHLWGWMLGTTAAVADRKNGGR